MRIQGNATTTAVTPVFVGGTVNEQTTGAQRSVKSASANDAAAGTGVRTVSVKYYTLAADGTITGPFVEIVALNGVTAVPTVATNIALVESIVALTVGSGGVAAGTITLFAANDGTGAAVAALLAGDITTRNAVTYVPSGRKLNILGFNGEATVASGLFALKVQPYPSANIPEYDVITANTPRDLSALPIIVAGPARVRAFVTPSSTGSTINRVDVAAYKS